LVLLLKRYITVLVKLDKYNRHFSGGPTYVNALSTRLASIIKQAHAFCDIRNEAEEGIFVIRFCSVMFERRE
jgi:hypothetical protein